jgi:hypothetical protein
MTSAINTGTINTNYPTAGVNNPSQGFRDNFAGIKNNLDTAGSEITDLQSKVLLKSALTGTTLNNDMTGGQISNVLTLGFRGTTYQLGSNMSGTQDIDCTKGDVHYGTVTGDLNLTFSKWAPAETKGTVELILNVQPGQKITLPATVTNGIDSIEGYTSGGVSEVVIIPANVSRVHWLFSSIDCGSTVEIQPIDRPRVTNQIKYGTPLSCYGTEGDVAGDIMVNSTHLYICVADYTDGSVNLWSKTPLGTTAW